MILPEDEVILPPLLNRVRTEVGGIPDGLNARTPQGRFRRAVPGEWFDYGESLELSAGVSFEVLQNESLAWVAGGVFQGTLGNYDRTQSSLVQYALAMSRGWIRVWISPGKRESLVRIEASGDVFTAKDADFWLNVRTGAVDLYVIRGEVQSKTSETAFPARTYVSLIAGKKTPKSRSDAWDAQAMEVHIASAYPGLVRLADEASRDWESGKSSRLFSEFRKKGWRKFHRLTPNLGKQ